ncbi:ABC transporter ATP-binding protein [Shimazuella alba]|uniref:Dipeptide ABC transporter ATP-binding protein n=1 Tax=Shimazuella alba TaxID=2690964 RepID=A0A6I4VSW8_9BACL|nr:dipeptide ABC transporter ATP-binding protein [Shimazuella alba]MXQ53531.1 dipeptide ABC transporter ATP-binding protein [Shimazuella alba]
MSTLLQVTNLKKHFPVTKGFFQKQVGAVKSVDGISFEMQEGKTLGIVGESGCGKSTTGRALLRILEPTEGEVVFDGVNIGKLTKDELRSFRTNMQMIFQDPYASLNPRWTVQQVLEEPLLTHGKNSKETIKQRVTELMELVGLSPQQAGRFPHEFSGGQRQRIGIARAIALNPKFIVCDEPVSALDVSIQAQVLNLMKDLQQKFSLTYLFISHDLSVVKFISDRVGVMYLGKLVELAPTDEVFAEPLHPYTKALISAVPVPDPEAKREQIVLSGDVPSALNPPKGCAFHTRCPVAMDVCKSVVPKWQEVSTGRQIACHLYE